MHARTLAISAIAATFLMGTMIPERAHAGGADGILGLAAGMIIGGAIAQRQPQPVYRYRTYRPRRVVQRRTVRQNPGAAAQVRQELRRPSRVADDPFASQSSTRPASFR